MGSRLMPWLRLCRVGNVFTAFADVWMGYAVASGWLTIWDAGRWRAWGLLTVASGSLYTAGMVWNDYFDAELDREERPERPIPSGAISREAARRLGLLLLVVGNMAAWGAGAVTPGAAWWLPGTIALVLSAVILAYDGGLKRTAAGPIAMGACRSLNVLLGMSLIEGGMSQWHAGHGTIAAGLGLYVAGITVLARSEVERGSRTGPAIGLIVMLAGIAVLSQMDRGVPESLRSGFRPEWAWWGLLALLVFPVFRRGLAAVLDPRPERIRAVVGLAILTVIVLDASVALVWRGQLAGISILALLAPAYGITRVVPPT